MKKILRVTVMGLLAASAILSGCSTFGIREFSEIARQNNARIMTLQRGMTGGIIDRLIRFAAEISEEIWHMRYLPKYGLAVLSVIMLAACSGITGSSGPDGTGLQLGSLLNLDVAMVSADALIEDVAELQSDFSGAIGGMSAEPFEATSSTTLKRVREVTYYDADGNEQDAYDGITTASVHIVSEISGERARDNWSNSVSRTREITVTGLEGKEVIRTANGIGSSTRSRSYHSDADGDRSYEMSGSSVITDVVRAVPKEENNPYCYA